MVIRDKKFIEDVLPKYLAVCETTVFVAFMGRRKSGKSEAAKLLRKYDSRHRILSFAGTLKDEFSKEKGIPRIDLDDITLKEQYREDLQTYSESYLSVDPFYFVKRMLDNVRAGDRVIIDDLRYLHELWALYALGAQVHILKSENHIKKSRGWVYNPIADNHVSETELGDLSAYTVYQLGGTCIFNNGDLANLSDQIFNIAKKGLLCQV